MTLLLDSPLASAITGFDAITANGEIYGGQDCIDGLVSIPGYLDIVTAPDGQTAMRSRITGSDALTYGGIRSEVDWTPDTGERWYVFDVYLPHFVDDGVQFSFMQIHDSPDGGESPVKFPNFEFTVQDGNIVCLVPLSTPSEATSSSREIARFPGTFGRFVKCTLHVNWATDSTGWLEVYYDGYKVAQEWSRASGYSDAVGPYIKLGLYDLFHVGFSGEREAYYRNVQIYDSGHSVTNVLGRRPRSCLPFLLA